MFQINIISGTFKYCCHRKLYITIIMRLHILGASASGVTTTGRLLAERLGAAYFDSDDYFWIKTAQPYTERRDPILRNQLIMNDIKSTEKWILGGSVIHWGSELFNDFDLIVFLYVPQEIRIQRLAKRELERYGDIIYTDKIRNRQFTDFLAWAKDYDHDTGIANRTLKAHEGWLNKRQCPILRITGNYAAGEILQMIIEKLKNLDIFLK
jgi:adenylate kinase family enzyme